MNSHNTRSSSQGDLHGYCVDIDNLDHASNSSDISIQDQYIQLHHEQLNFQHMSEISTNFWPPRSPGELLEEETVSDIDAIRTSRFPTLSNRGAYDWPYSVGPDIECPFSIGNALESEPPFSSRPEETLLNRPAGAHTMPNHDMPTHQSTLLVINEFKKCCRGSEEKRLANRNAAAKSRASKKARKMILETRANETCTQITALGKVECDCCRRRRTRQ